jgi:PKD repeat protein
MKKIAFFIILSIIFSKSVFSQDCEAWFWQNQDSLNPMLIHFYSDCFPQNEIIEYQWDFGDGSFSSEQFPSYEYSLEGDFLVTLAITTPICNNTVQNTVSVYNTVQTNCSAEFYFEVSGADMLTVNFVDNSFISNPNLNEWYWDFGDGFTSTEQFPIHIYNTPGVYFVLLNLTTEDCFSTFESEVFVGDNYYNGTDCIAMFSFEQISPGGLTFQFYDASWLANDTIIYQSWDFGTNVYSEESYPVYTFPSPGEYVVNYTISTNNCTSTQQSIIYTGDSVWYPETCQALFWIEPNPADEYEIQFYDFSYVVGEIQYWEWNFGDGEFSYIQNPVHTYLTDGQYIPSLMIISDSCQSYIEFQIDIPIQNYIPSNCECIFYAEMVADSVTFFDLSTGNPQTWNWNFGDGTYSSLQSPSHVFDGLGIHEIALAIGGNGCNNNSGMVLNLDNSQISYMFLPVIPSNISESTDNQTIVFPNPVADNLNIISKNNEIVLVQIIEISGKTVISKYVNKSEKNISIDIANIPQGVYILKITYENKTIGSYKIVK